MIVDQVHGVLRGCRAQFGGRLVRVGEYQDAMDMIGHNDPGIQFYMGMMVGQFQPMGSNHLPQFIQPHFTVYNFT